MLQVLVTAGAWMIKGDQFLDLQFVTTNPCVIFSMSPGDGGEARTGHGTEVKEGARRGGRMSVLKLTGCLRKTFVVEGFFSDFKSFLGLHIVVTY